MIRMQIQLDERQAQAVRRAAEQLGVSQAEIVRRSLDAYLGKPPRPDRNTLRKRAWSAIGAFRGVDRDVSVRHDEYLARTLRDWTENDPS
ncbi:MAG: ribbon-helix-helix domain-containing protein [Thermoleophilia bacterium]|nr:ribbon-helix-helix domain-containing protein [Thermoleophilia bacterium]